MSRKEKIISISAIAFLLAAVIVLVIILGTLKPYSQESKVKSYELKEQYFDTVSRINEYNGASEDDFEKMCVAAEGVFERYHRLCDIYNTYDGINNLKTINDSAGASVKIDAELMDILSFSVDMYELTDGALNIAMGAVLELWHEHRMSSPATVPEKEALESAVAHCNIEDIKLNKENMTVTLMDPEMSLDLGAVAKGYAVERAAELLISMGADGYAINAGGNIRLIGSRTENRDFEVGIRDPEDEGGILTTLMLKNTSAVTSGGYNRYYVVNGKKYHHIIDGNTLMPAEHHLSVTVVHPDSGIADCLSTALFATDTARGELILKNFENAGYGAAQVHYVPTVQ